MCQSNEEALEQAKNGIPFLWEYIQAERYGDAPRRTLRACLARIVNQ